MVLETIAVDQAKRLLSGVLAKAGEEIVLIWEFKGELKKLKQHLRMVQALLAQAGTKRPLAELELAWVEDVRDLAYKADNLLDELAYENLRRKVIKDRHSVLSALSTPLGLGFQLRMAHKVKKMMSSIDALSDVANGFGIRAIELVQPASNYGGSSGEGTSTASELRQCREGADTLQLIGRERDRSDLVKALCNGSNDVEDLRFIAVVGLPGIGKTTLARRTYHSEAVNKSFAETIWICVSTDFEISKILGQMVEHLTLSKPELMSKEALINKLRKEMDRKKYLLVLDDVWNNKPLLWQSLKSCLLRIGGSSGSMVLITARSNDVAKSAKASWVHELEGLSPDSSWALFEQTAFNDEKCPSNLETIGKQIVDKCKGVPLAITTLGATLQSNTSPHYWESIANSELCTTQAFEDIAPYLLLTFQNLPSLEVKQCFAYCSIYEKDAIIVKEDLIRLWMAQGFLFPDGGNSMNMEEIGAKHFRMLLDHFFLQVGGFDEYGGIRSCIMHDLVHDLARFVSKRDWLICGKGVGLDREHHISHLVVGSDMAVEVSTPSFMEIMSTTGLRTVKSFVELPSDRLMQSRHVRVLILSRIGLKEVPNVVGEFKHLRYLDVSYNLIKELPEPITTLYLLQTLKIVGCAKLHKLPRGLSKLVNLRHILHSHNFLVEVPPGLKKLTCLQTLPGLKLTGSGGASSLDELGCLPNVKGQLHISGLENVQSKEEAQRADLGRKAGILSLHLEWSSDRAEIDSNTFSLNINSHVVGEDVLDALQPHPNIRCLMVFGYNGDSFLSWPTKNSVGSVDIGPSTSLNNLAVVVLKDCRRCKHLPTLGQLPHLKALHIIQMKELRQISREFYTNVDGHCVQPFASTSGLFPSLTRLEITVCPILEAWVPPQTMFPSQVAFRCLETLKIMGCPLLTITPSDFPSLRHLELKGIQSAKPLYDIITTIASKYGEHNSLTSLILYEIQELTNLPQGLSHRLSSLETLQITRCYKLDCLPDDLGRLISLKTLNISQSSKLKTFPEIGGLCSLIELVIQFCAELEEIPSGLDRCTSLQSLVIGGCPNMGLKRRLEEENIRGGGEVTDYWTGEWLGRLLHLRTFAVGGNGFGLREEEQPDRFFPDITPLHTMKSLRCLVLRGWPKLKSLPDQLELFTLLEILGISAFDGMEEIPEFIGGLPSLFRLGIDSCSNLKRFPSRGTMLKLKQLTSLRISGCPLLTEGCRKDDGPEWHKISHIKYITIDGEFIQFFEFCGNEFKLPAVKA